MSGTTRQIPEEEEEAEVGKVPTVVTINTTPPPPSTQTNNEVESRQSSKLGAPITPLDSSKVGSQRLGSNVSFPSNGTIDRNSVSNSSLNHNQKPMLEQLNVYIDGTHPCINTLLPSFVQYVDPEKMISKKTLITRRFSKLRNTLIRMTTPGGCELSLKKRKKLTKSYDYSCTATDLLDWLQNPSGGGFGSKLEAEKYLTIMIEYGYLINCEWNTTFVDDGSYFTLQSPLLWHDEFWSPSEEDYLCYLLRRDSKDKNLLKWYEKERLSFYTVKFGEKMPVIHEKVASQVEVLEKLGKHEQKRFTFQEFGFWLYYCPDPDGKSVNEDRVEKEEKECSHTEEMFERTAKPEQLLTYWTKKVKQLQLNSTLNFRKVSAASKSLVGYCELYLPVEPFTNISEGSNYWHRTEKLEKYDPFKETKKILTLHDFKVWVNSFEALLTDQIGLSLFKEFLQKERSSENINFWERVESLDGIASRQEFNRAAKVIYTEFISSTSNQEINVPSHIKQSLSSIFESPSTTTTTTTTTNNNNTNNLELESKPIEYDIFREAKKHVLQLMQSDSYNRFCQSELLASRYKKELKEKYRKQFPNPMSLKIGGMEKSKLNLLCSQ